VEVIYTREISSGRQYEGRADLGSITRRINGGYGGLDVRLRHRLRARRALAVS
jgi:predicted chitinase